MIQSPKTRFLQNKQAVNKLLDITVDTNFIAAIDAAMLETMATLPMQTEGGVAMANGFRMEGAVMFMRHLMNIAEKVTLPTPVKDVPNLNHKA